MDFERFTKALDQLGFTAESRGWRLLSLPGSLLLHVYCSKAKVSVEVESTNEYDYSTVLYEGPTFDGRLLGDILKFIEVLTASRGVLDSASVAISESKVIQ